MAFGDVRGTLTGGANSITNPIAATGSVSVQVGDLVVFVISQQTNLTAGNVTDNLHGATTYTATNAGLDPGSPTYRAYYHRVTVAGTLTSISCVATASTNDVSVGAVVFEGPFRAVTPLDINSANTEDITSPFTSAASGTLAQADELIVCTSSANTTSTWTADGSMVSRLQHSHSANCGVRIGSWVVSATSSVTPAWSFGGSAPADNVMQTLTFRKDTGIAVGSADGTGASSVVGASTAASPGSASGTGASSVVGASTAASPGSASGAGAADAVGEEAAGGDNATKTGMFLVF